MSSDLANLVVVLLIALSMAQLVAIVVASTARRQRGEREARVWRRQEEGFRSLQQMGATMQTLVQRQESLLHALERVGAGLRDPSRPPDALASPMPVIEPPPRSTPLLGRIASNADDTVHAALVSVAEALDRASSNQSPEAAAMRRAVLGQALKLSAGPSPGVRSTTELIWQLELLGEQLACLGADDSPHWKQLYDAVSAMCRGLYGQQLEIFLPGNGEPVHEEFHEVSGAGGATISRALRWGINDTTRGCNVLRARVETG